MDILNLIKEKKNEIIKIASKHGAYNIRIFGSVAKNKSDENSDVDFLVDVGGTISSWFPSGLIIELENLLKIKVDIATVNALKKRIRAKVLQEAKPL